MAEPFLHTLSNAARAAYPIIQRGVREGLSSRRITDALKEGGLALRRQTLLEVMRLEKDVQNKGAQLKFLRPNFLPNPSRLPEALTKIRRPFSFTVEVRGQATATGQPLLQHVTVATDRLLTRAQIEELGVLAAERGSERYGLEVESAVVIGGLRAGPLGTF